MTIPEEKYYKFMAATAEQWTDKDNPPKILKERGKRINEDNESYYILTGAECAVDLGQDQEEVKTIHLTDWIVYYGGGLWSFVPDENFRLSFWPEEIVREAMGRFLQERSH